MRNLAARKVYKPATSVCAAVIMAVGLGMLVASVVNAQVRQIDQENDVPWLGAVTNIVPDNQVGQSFVPSCSNLVSVAVDLTTLNPGRGDDRVTARILHEGREIASLAQVVEDGFDGWLEFDIVDVEVTPGKTYVLQLADTGKVTFGWKYIVGDPYPLGSGFSSGLEVGDFLFRTYSTSCPGSIWVGIDVMPGSDPNCFNIDGHGVVPVAILGSDTVDVERIDTRTLLFNGLNVRGRGKRRASCAIEDVNEDGFSDLVCQFEDDLDKWTGEDSIGTLTGRLLDGTAIEGSDDICLVP